MSSSVVFPFLDHEPLPKIPVALSFQGSAVSAEALLDSGATINVLPYDLGLQLGAVWEQQTLRLPLAGNLASVEARGVFVSVQVGNLDVVRLAFAWTASSQVPLILGQTNFFQEFDVCFIRSQQTIEVKRRLVVE
jgi:hypothetical protein